MQKKSKEGSNGLSLNLQIQGYPDFLALNRWKKSEQHRATKFPTFFELVEEDNTQRISSETNSELSRKKEGLFSALVGDPRVLYQEFLEDPSRFDDEAARLIQLLSSGTLQLSRLTSAEWDVLNKATLDYVQPRRPDSWKPSSQKTTDSERPAVRQLTGGEEELEHREDGRHVPVSQSTPDLPIDAPATFWWRK